MKDKDARARTGELRERVVYVENKVKYGVLSHLEVDECPKCKHKTLWYVGNVSTTSDSGLTWGTNVYGIYLDVTDEKRQCLTCGTTQTLVEDKWVTDKPPKEKKK